MTSPAASSQSSFKTAEDAESTGFNAGEAEAVQPTDEEPKTPTKVVDIHADPEPSENSNTDPTAEQQEQESSKPTGDAEPDADADASTPQPQPSTLPVLTPLPPLPSVPSDGSMSDMLSAVATIGSDPPAASSTSSIAPHDTSSAAAQNMTEAEVDAAIKAEMDELKAEIAVLRSSIADSSDGGQGDGKRDDAEEDVLRMAEFKLDYVEKSMRRL